MPRSSVVLSGRQLTSALGRADKNRWLYSTAGGMEVGVATAVGGRKVARAARVGAAVGVQVCVAAAVNAGVAEINGALAPHEISEMITTIVKSVNTKRY